MVSMMKLYVVELSTWMGVGGCRWPNSSAVVLRTMAFWQFIYRVDVSHSAADPIMGLMTLHSWYIDPCGRSGCPIGVLSPK